MPQADIWSEFRSGMKPDRASAWRSACLEVLRLSGLFDAASYLARRGALAVGVDPLEDYHDHGWRAGHWPNAYFDPAWYAAEHPDVAAASADPLLHYVSYGEREGRRPVLWFDPAWYRAHHTVPADMHCLRHFLQHRFDGSASPCALLDGAWYLATYPDVAAAGMDPAEHFLVQGFREGRNPSEGFDTRWYRMRYLGGARDINPLLHFLRHGGEPGVHASMPASQTTVAREVRRFAAPGPGFEPVRALQPDAMRRALVLAFYLPQFHPIAQNDAWWGTGFTEWTNVARGLPRFAGHYQPRIARDLGQYRLDDPAVLPRQVALARGAGIGGFVWYFYWFDGVRLLDAPLEAFLADRSVDFPFCLMWANENWTRRWDGSDDEVLIAQTYRRDDEAALIACFARHFADPRYLRLDGRPVLMIYRASLIPAARATIARWRAHFAQVHGQAPLLIMAQSFDDIDPARFGMDGAVEFPPHGLMRGLPQINAELDLLDHDFNAQVYEYDAAVQAACAAPAPAYALIRSAMPGWDNDARRQGAGMVVQGATPARFGAWLAHLVEQAQARPFWGTPLVCINAWNEWAEGAYLEPDQHWGAAFANAAGRAIAGQEGHGDEAGPLLLVGHDAFAAGAQLLLLHVARRLRAAHGARIEIVLCGGGALEPAYRAVAPVHLVSGAGALQDTIAGLRAKGCHSAVVNSAAAAWCCPALHASGIETTLLVHEMPVLLDSRGLVAPLRAALAVVRSVVFAAPAVRDAVARVAPLDHVRSLIRPQGLYQTLEADRGAGAVLRATWGVGADDRLAVAIGYGDLRKGIDLFVQVWRLAAAADAGLHMVWVGDADPDVQRWLEVELAAATATGRFRLTGWCDDVARVLAAADLFVLCSREDAYPSVALEALRMGLPVVAFAGGGGIPALLDPAADAVVPMGDCPAMAAAVLRIATRARDAPRIDRLPDGHGLEAYVAWLLRQAAPGQACVSVIVPSYRQAAWLPRRLGSIFDQTVPVHEVVVRDDASDDGSADVARQVADAAGRVVAVVQAEANSGSPFGCWRDAVARATGELVWIAEADDACAPGLLARLTAPFATAPDLVLAVCDSRPVDGVGLARPERYRDSYEAVAGAGALAEDGVYDAPEFARRFLAERNLLFNVSAVVWRRSALLAALDQLGDGLLTWRVAGDWRLYWEVLSGGGQVAFIAQALNEHRRGDTSVTSRLDPGAHLREIARIHRMVRKKLGETAALRARQAAYRVEVAAYLRTALALRGVAGKDKPG